MALFGSKKNKKAEAEVTPEAPKAKKAPAKRATKATKAKPETTETAVVAAPVASTSSRDLTHILRRPRITEKSAMIAETNVYLFDVASSATKSTIAAAVKLQYNVTPRKVAIVNMPRKQVYVRNKLGMKGGGKKAYVYLDKGQTIEFV